MSKVGSTRKEKAYNCFVPEFRSRWNSVVGEITKKRSIIVESQELTGIFEKTPGAIKSSSGVTYGLGGVKKDEK